MKKKIIDNVLKQNNFTDYKWISPKKIKVAHWVRLKCSFGCGDYGKAPCPPNTPDVMECRKIIREYKKAIIVHCSFEADKNNYPKEIANKYSTNLRNIEKELFTMGYYKTFLLDQDCCSVCTGCADSRQECRSKKYSRPSAEAFSIDVYKTAMSIGYPINVIKSEISMINRYAILLIE